MDIEEKIAGEIALSDNFGKTLQKWREEFLITKTELAKEMDVPLSMITDYESGRRKSPGINTIRKFVYALIEIEKEHGGSILRRYSSGVPYEALIDIGDYHRDVNLKNVISRIEGKSTSSADLNRYIRGYTIVNGVKAILSFSYSEYSLLYGWSSQRVIFFTEVKMGRSPMIAIRVHPLKPAAVVYIQADRVDELAIRLSDVENIPLITTELPPMEVAKIMSQIR
jgi:putative transcriptional regulator